MELRFDVAGSPSLPEPVRARLLARRDRRLTDEGVLVLSAQRFRTQDRNREDARDRLAAFIDAGLHVPKARVATKPTRGLEAAQAGRKARTQYDQARAHASRLGLTRQDDTGKGDGDTETRRGRPRAAVAAERAARAAESRSRAGSAARCCGWAAGAWSASSPTCRELVLIGAPHSSNWDGVWGFAAKLALGLDIKILGKHQLFWWPLGPILAGSA